MDVMFLLASKDYGGAEAYVTKVIKGLRDEFEFSIACPHELRENTYFIRTVKNLNVKTYFYRRPYPFDPRSMFEIAKILHLIRPKILHANMNWIGNCASELMVASYLKQPYIMTQHIVPPDVRTDLIRKSVIKRNLRRADRVICVSDYTRANVLKYNCEILNNIEVVHNGIDVTCVPPLRQNEHYRPIRFITVARLTPQKGISYLLESIALSTASLHNVEFLMVGDGPMRMELENRTRELNLQSIVKFIGFQSNVQDLLRQSDVFILPSIEEGLPFTILEAMEAGVPVIATNVGGNHELIRHEYNGILVPPCDIETMSRELIRLAGDEKLRERFGIAGRNTVIEEFNTNNMISRLSDIYHVYV